MNRPSKALSVLVALFSAAGCSGRVPSPRAASLLLQLEKAGPALKASYLPSPPYYVQYGLFRDLQPGRWGKGRVLCAFMRHELGFESRLLSLTAGPGAGILYLDGDREHRRPHMLAQMSGDGTMVSSTTVRNPTDELRVGRFAGRDVLFLRGGPDLYALDPVSSDSWHVDGATLRFAPFSLGDEDRPGLLIYSPVDGGRMAVRRNDGTLVRERSGVGNITDPLPVHLPGRKEDAIMAVDWAAGKRRLELLDIAGTVIFSTSTAEIDPSLLAVGKGDRSGALLVSVASGWPNTRQVLRVWRLTGKSMTLESESELGWVTVKRLLLADLDGDGQEEVLLGGSDGWVLVYSQSGRLLAEHKLGGEITQMSEAGPKGGGAAQVVIGVGDVIPPEIFSVGVIDDPGPWRP